ncbi:unnamed protein product [Cunninghamella blakesleeana]
MDFTFLIDLIKLSRNSVAANKEGQQLAYENGVLDQIISIIQIHLNFLSEQSMMIVKVGTQAICNFVTGNDQILNKVWTKWCQDQSSLVWNKVIECNDKDSITSSLILVSQCIRDNHERCKLLVTSSNGIIILKSVLMEIDRSHSEETNQHFELGYIIINEILKLGYFVNAMNILKEANGTIIVNQYQTVLVKILDSTLYKHPEIKIPFTENDFELINEFLRDLCSEASKVIEHAVVTHRDQLSNIELDDVSLVYTCLVLTFQIVNVLITSTEYNQPMKSNLNKHDTMKIIIDLLGQCEKMVDWNDKEKSKLGFHYLKREIVKCIGSLCYKDKSNQDLVREYGGLPLILNQMKIDETNPYIREHAVLALRHILENNIENQQLISEMKPIEAIQSKELDEMGLQTSLIDGKVQVKNKDK